MERISWKSSRPKAMTVLAAAALLTGLLTAAGTVAACGDDSDTGGVPPLPSASASATASPTSSPSPTASHVADSITGGSFTSSGDLISGWYWLRDAEYLQTAVWTFDSLPANGDVTLHCEALATDAANGSRDVDAHFYLSYGRAATSTEGPLFFGQIDVTLPNVSPDSDPLGYACRGDVTIPRTGLHGAQNLAIMISRSASSADLAPIDGHVAFAAGSVVVSPAGTSTGTGTGTGTGTQVSTAAFWSNGDFISGWYWLRDAAYQDAATWVVKDVPAGLTSVVVELQVLATNGVDGGRGYDGRFSMSWGALEGDTVNFGTPKPVTLPNTAGADDPVGYQCSGWTTIALPTFGAERTLVIQIRRNDTSGGRPAMTRHIAVMANSVSVLFGE
jgi:hypothetical protein